MAQIEHTTDRRKFKHLEFKDRVRIEVLNKLCYSTRKIAVEIGFCHSAVSRELQRGSVTQLTTDLVEKKVYFADVGQRRYDENRAQCGPRMKLVAVSEFLEHAETQILENGLSPDAIVGSYRIAADTAGKPCVCTKTLYNYIDMGLLKVRNIDLNLKVRRKPKKARVRKHRRILGDSIELRPKEVDSRETFGHWEIDTVVGRRSETPALLTILERKTRQYIIRPLATHTVEKQSQTH